MKVVGRRVTLRFMESWDFVTVVGDGLHAGHERTLIVRLAAPIHWSGRTYHAAQLQPRFVGGRLQANDAVHPTPANYALLETEGDAQRGPGSPGGIADFRLADAIDAER